MKHWGELTDLETAIIRVGEFKNLFKLLVAGTENYVDIKVLQSAIYTMETMIDDIDSTLYEKFQTVWDCVRDEAAEPPEEYEFDTLQEEYEFESKWPFDNMNSTSENKGSTVQINSTFEEDEAFKDLEKAIRNWKPTAP
jgi:non-ribosomal peptide synthetase component F